MKLAQDIQNQPSTDYRFDDGIFTSLDGVVFDETLLEKQGWDVAAELGISTFCFRVYNKGDTWIVIDLVHEGEAGSVVIDGLQNYYLYLRDYVRPVLNLHIEARALDKDA